MGADIIGSISAAVTIATNLRKWSAKIKDIEFKNFLADLSNELADAKLEAANLKDEIVRLRNENANFVALSAKAASEKPLVKWGCYVFPGDETLYCPGCYEDRGKKIPTSRAVGIHRLCPSCKAVLG